MTFVHFFLSFNYALIRVRAELAPLSPSIICEGYWQRKDPFTNCDITKYYHLSSATKHWYGVPNHRIHVIASGQGRLYRGTFRSTRCLKLAVKADGRTPNGTMTCSQCARVPTLPSFVAMVAREERDMPMEKISRPNVYLTLTAARKKLTLLASQIKILRKKSSRLLQRKRTVAAQEALQRSDVKKFTKELQFIAQRGTLEDKRVMWSYLKDVVHNEYLTEKNDKGKGAYPSRTHTHIPSPSPTYIHKARMECVGPPIQKILPVRKN